MDSAFRATRSGRWTIVPSNTCGPAATDSIMAPNSARMAAASGGVHPLLWRQVRRCLRPLCYETDAGSTSRVIAHRKAAISRAIAVITTVLRFPFAVRRR